MAVSLNITDDTTRAALAAGAESRALGPAKESLIGLTREELAEALIGVGVPERQADEVIEALRATKVKGRRVNVRRFVDER